jgi:hypothetical protein
VSERALLSVAEVFDRARAVSARDVAENACGALLRGGGPRGWARAKRCPLCEGKNDFSCSPGGFRCHKCGEHGDGIALYAKFAGLSMLEAACHVAGVHLEEVATRENVDRATWQARREAAQARAEAQRARTRREPDDDAPALARVNGLWLTARPAAGTIVERYLVHRGVPHWLAHLAARRLRLAPAAPWWDPEVEDNYRRPPDHVTPAMLALVETPEGTTGGLHVTHLAPDGRGKAAFSPAKKMLGPQTDARGRPGGVLLIPPPEAGATLVVGEGIESALSTAAIFRQLHPRASVGVFAALSLDRLQGGLGRGPWGGANWRRPSPDPDAPAATWPHDGPVLIGVDHDMAPLTVDRGTRWEHQISPTRRAQVAGVLAAHWWRAPRERGGAGASDVAIFTPRAGADANDLVRRAAQ